MTVINGKALLGQAPIAHMLDSKHRCPQSNVSYGLAEVGYDIRIKQSVLFIPGEIMTVYGHCVKTCDHVQLYDVDDTSSIEPGNFTLASAMEEFQMPDRLMGIVHDKSTWARHGLSVFNTVIEPGWKGFLTLELFFRGNNKLFIPAGAGIAQVIFHEIEQRANYEGVYQNQADMPVGSALKQI